GFIRTAATMQIWQWPGVTARQKLDRQRFGRAGERNINDFTAPEMVRSFDQAGRGAERDVLGAEDHLDPIQVHLRLRPGRPQTLLTVEGDEPVAPATFDDVGRAEERSDELGPRVVVNLVRGAELFQPPAV